MYKFIVLVLAILVSSYAADFSQSKKILLKQIYPDHQKTFYCENSYKLDIVDGKEKTVIINDINRYSPRKPNRPESKFVNWEHVMPASKLGSTLVCWKNGGRKACRNDTLFKKMESDMHNLVPSIAELNSDRGNFEFGDKLPTPEQYGQCRFEVDFKAKRAYPREDIRGDIARIYFYMSDKYNINLSKQERRMMEVWDKQDPIDEWERIKNKRVEKLQGNANPYIK